MLYFDCLDINFEDKDIKMELLWDSTKIKDINRLEGIVMKCRKAFEAEYPNEHFSFDGFMACVRGKQYNLDVFESDISSTLKEFKNKDSCDWTEDEKRRFEYAYLRVGADFRQISEFVKTKSVPEVMHRYFCWKNSKEYHAFIDRETAFYEAKRQERKEKRKMHEKMTIEDKTENEAETKPTKKRRNPLLEMASKRNKKQT